MVSKKICWNKKYNSKKKVLTLLNAINYQLKTTSETKGYLINDKNVLVPINSLKPKMFYFEVWETAKIDFKYRKGTPIFCNKCFNGILNEDVCFNCKGNRLFVEKWILPDINIEE